jgi:two-component system cell cycle response regulator
MRFLRAQLRMTVRKDGWLLLFAPVGCGIVALGVLVYDHFRAVDSVSLAVASGALIVVFARMALTFAENRKMIAASGRKARTDVLTGLGNRRQLLDDLTAALDAGTASVLAHFDVNSFKSYNDSFGHLAGDTLLARLGENLARFVSGRGTAYRIGGDEFCILCDGAAETADMLVGGAARALTDRGEGFAITVAHGAVLLPGDALTSTDALQLADQRMYDHKHGSRSSASEQSSGVLLRVVAERDPTLGDHQLGVAELVEAVAVKLGLPAGEVARARLAAALHDVGKMGVPDAILEKAGPLTEDEWKFLYRHTLIGERILQAATALSHVAGIVRSSHERYDGTGYPDGIAGADVPLAARIVFVCDAFDAMTSARPYAATLTADEALAELDRCAGTQFDPDVVAAFGAVLADRVPAPAESAEAAPPLRLIAKSA